MNMPFKLSLGFRCWDFGGSRLAINGFWCRKNKKYCYQVALSHLARSDFEAHEGLTRELRAVLGREVDLLRVGTIDNG